MDEDGNGKIDSEEFLKYMMEYPYKLSQVGQQRIAAGRPHGGVQGIRQGVFGSYQPDTA